MIDRMSTAGTVAMLLLVLIAPAFAGKPKQVAEVDGKKVFEQNCSRCHLGGGNQVKPSRPVAQSKVLASIVTFKAYLSAPPGHMPYYQNVVKSPQILKALYNYCKTLKAEPLKQASATYLTRPFD